MKERDFNRAGARRVNGNAGTTPVTNFLGTTDGTDIAFRTNNVEVARMTASRNVGIGITTPGQKLHVVGTTRISTLASGANGAIVRSNANGDLTITNLTGSAGDVLLGNGTFGAGTSFADNLGNHIATINLNMNSKRTNPF